MKNKILPILCIFIIVSCLLIGNVFAASYDLSDYVNHIPYNNNWAIVYSHSTKEFYLLGDMGADYPYILSTGITTTEEGKIVSNSFICARTPENAWSRQGSLQVFKFDEKTSTFGSYVKYTSSNNFTCEQMELIASNSDIYVVNGTEPFFFKNSSSFTGSYGTTDSGGGSGGSETDTNVPDYDAWYDSIFNSISSWVGSLLEGLATPFEGIAQGIVNLGKSFSSILDYLNPLSEKFILLDVFKFFNSIINFLNPFSNEFFGYKLVEFIGELLEKLFIPQQDHFGELNEIINSKFGFIGQFKDLVYNFFGLKEVENGNTALKTVDDYDYPRLLYYL